MNNQRTTNSATVAVMVLLFIVAIIGIAGCFYFGQEVHRDAVSRGEGPVFDMVTSDSGLNGGAIGCGIFGAVSLYGFVKVFLARTN